MFFLEKIENILSNISFTYNKRKEVVYYKKNLLDFSSNNYLGLNHNSGLIKIMSGVMKEEGSGACSSKFVSGYSQYYELTKELLQELYKAEDATIFTSGYNTNIAIFEALCEREDIIFLDELSHASAFAGAKNSGATIMRFKHNDIIDLSHKIQKYAKGRGQIFIFTEVVFSMSGTLLLNQEEYINIAKKHNAVLVTDAAHSFGIFKTHFPQYNLHLQMGSLSKAIPIVGGYVCGSKAVIEYIRQKAKIGIYTTAMPAYVLAGVVYCLQQIQNGLNGAKALQNATYFYNLYKNKQGLCFYGTQIIFLDCKNNTHALQLEESLLLEGILVKAIRSPTVKTPGIRITFNNLQKKKDIKKLLDKLETCY